MKIGDKVVCVDDSPCRNCGVARLLKDNTVYVVAAINSFDGGLFLVGIPDHCAGSWMRERFRLLDELKQEAQQRTSMLTQREKKG